MSARTENRYRSRSARPSREERASTQGDAVVMALTIQVLVCALLLLVAVVAKKADETGYGEVKAQYEIMAGDGAQMNRFAALAQVWTGDTGGFFAGVERWLSGLTRGQASGESDTPQPYSEENQTEQSGSQSLVPEAALQEGIFPRDEKALSPEGGEGAAPEEEGAALPGGETASSGFQFDYLGPGEATAMALSYKLGQGGLYLVEPGDDMTAPAGATLAPVALSGRMKPPLTGIITSSYAYRFHPISGDSDFHNGMDIAAPEGTAIVAALPGEVVEVGYSDIYGHYVILKHATNLETFYGHCSEIIAREGMAVRQGERIARVGQTGVATGPHLHFSVIVDETFADPGWILGNNIRVVE